MSACFCVDGRKPWEQSVWYYVWVKELTFYFSKIYAKLCTVHIDPLKFLFERASDFSEGTIRSLFVPVIPE